MAEVAATVATAPPSHDSVFSRTPGYKPLGEQVPEQEAAPAPDPAIPETEAKIPEQQAKPATEEEEDEISDEAFAKAYYKKTGKKLESIDDLKDAPKPPTAEELALAAERESTEALEWGLGTERIKKDFYEKSIADKAKEKRAIALSIFSDELKEEDPTMSADECEERFKDYYCEEEDESSWKRKRAIKAMEAVADNYLAQYKSVDTLVDDYRAYKTVTQTQKEYSKQLSAIGKTLPEKLTFDIPYTGLDGKETTLSYEVAVDDAIPKELMKEFSKPSMADYFGVNAKPEAIKAELDYHLRARMLEKIIPAIAEKHSERVLEDAMVNLKNARNPQQQIGGHPNQTAPKEPPSHDSVFRKNK